MLHQEEKLAKFFKSVGFVLFMLLLSSFFGPEMIFVLLLSLIYLKEG